MNNKLRIRSGTAIILASALVAMLTAVPYHLLATGAPGEMVFSGMSTNIPDESSYLMWSRQHAQGAFFVSNHMTTDPHTRIFPNPAWLAVGLTSRVTGEPVVVAYHIVRTGFSFLYLLVLWALMLRVLPTRNAARVAWTVIAVGGGLGWLELLGIPLPSADWITELWSWSSMLHYPHFALALLLLTSFFVTWVDLQERPCHLRAIVAGFLISLLALVHPYTASTLMAGMGVYFMFTLWRTARANPGQRGVLGKTIKSFPGALLMLAFAAPGFIIIAGQTMLNPMLAAWAEQNVMPSPPPWEYAIGFGLAGLGAIACFITAARRRLKLQEIHIFFIAWATVAILLAYADPLVPFARRCVEGIHIAIVVLAVVYIFQLKGHALIGGVILILATTLPAPLYHLDREVRADNPGYVVGDHYGMIEAIKTYVKDGSILSDARSSLFIAADTDARVFVGHHEVSPNFLDKAKLVHRFMNSPTSWLDRRDMLTRTKCDWLLGSPYMMDQPVKGAAGSAEFGLREYARGDSWVLVGPDGK